MNQYDQSVLITIENQITTHWSGGSTTELFIYPKSSDFKARNFDFRLSTATVEVETSDFTPLDSFQRVLMVLDGQLELQHEGHHSSSLSKFDVDRFSGGWNTKSLGKCRDFNLIYKPIFNVEMKGINLESTEIETILTDVNDWVFIYCLSGDCVVLFEDNVQVLNTKNLWGYHSLNSGKFTLQSTVFSEIVIVTLAPNGKEV